MRSGLGPVHSLAGPGPTIWVRQVQDRPLDSLSAKHCKGKGNGHPVCRYLDMSDFKSTGNLRKHARTCWGVETVAAADETGNLGAALDVLKVKRWVNNRGLSTSRKRESHLQPSPTHYHPISCRNCEVGC